MVVQFKWSTLVDPTIVQFSFICFIQRPHSLNKKACRMTRCCSFNGVISSVRWLKIKRPVAGSPERSSVIQVALGKSLETEEVTSKSWLQILWFFWTSAASEHFSAGSGTCPVLQKWIKVVLFWKVLHSRLDSISSVLLGEPVQSFQMKTWNHMNPDSRTFFYQEHPIMIQNMILICSFRMKLLFLLHQNLHLQFEWKDSFTFLWIISIISFHSDYQNLSDQNRTF